MRRLLAALICLVALAAVVVAPDPGPGAEPAGYRGIASAVLACPALAVTEDSASTLAGLVAEPVGAGAPGTAALRTIGDDQDLARIAAVGQPVSLLVADRSQGPILMRATGSWAPQGLAGVAAHELEGTGAGLASASCPAPRPEWWFVGAGSQLGRSAALLVSNPAQEPARFDLTFYARSGPVPALAGKGINLGPQSHVRLRLDALAPDEDLLAVQLRTTSGQVAAAIRDVAVPQGESPQGGSPQGVEYLGPTLAPDPLVRIAGIPAGEGARDLVLVNPGTQFATVRTRLLTESGPTELADLTALAVPAGSVSTTSLDRVLDGRSGTLELLSDVPITGGVRSSWGSDRRDVSWLTAVPAVVAPNLLAGAGAVPAGPGLTTTVTIAAPGTAVSGTLQVIGTGEAGDSVFTDEGLRDLARPPGVTVLTGEVTTAPPIVVSVPAGSQRTVTVPGTEQHALTHLAWRSDPGSGPALVSHLALDPDRPAATGYAWWPTVSAVRAVPVREDVGILAPAD
jgi:hypothetical protein